MMETPETDPYKAGIFYYSKTDKRVFVPKHYGWGWTINWANPWSYVFLFALFGLIFVIEYFAMHVKGK